MNTVSKKAAVQADVIQVVKIVLIIANLITAAALVVAGFLTRPGDAATVTGEAGYSYVESSGWGGWWVLVGAGATQAVVGSLLILVVLGWFEHMLRTQAETVRLADPQTVLA